MSTTIIAESTTLIYLFFSQGFRGHPGQRGPKGEQVCNKPSVRYPFSSRIVVDHCISSNEMQGLSGIPGGVGEKGKRGERVSSIIINNQVIFSDLICATMY